MAVSVGGVMVEFDGDASGAAAAMKAVSEKLDELVAKEKNLKVALDAATASGNVSEDAIRALKTAHADASTAVARLTGRLDEGGGEGGEGGGRRGEGGGESEERTGEGGGEASAGIGARGGDARRARREGAKGRRGDGHLAD